MNIIYVSNLISESKMNKIIEKANKKPLQSIQKFHRLLCKGFIANNIKVKTISAIPMSRKISNKTIWLDKKEKEDGICYHYVPFINYKGIRQICIALATAFLITKEIIFGKKKKVFVCDILDTTISYITLLLSKIFKYTCIGIATDLPENMSNATKLSHFLENDCDAYVLLTEQMNNKINLKNKPFIVMEGLVDSNMQLLSNTLNNKYTKKVCIYAGGIYEKYGVKLLVDAFKNLNIKDAELHLYGTGDLEKYLASIKNNKIKYYGVVENKKIVEEEIKATLLINPRFTKEEYTKYSFPSKNMEYMVSGTPILTTKLPGMPNEYIPYVYLFENETLEGYQKSLEQILKKPQQELFEKGKEAKEFMLKNKNNKKQASRIIYFINNTVTKEK